uniref:Cyclic nucleotide-gated cation channel alpha-3 n=1 Tax=Culex pipiens TaxID=7175 RepID=A0A8D8E029_CULPI
MHLHTRRSCPAAPTRRSSTTEARRLPPARHRPRRDCFQFDTALLLLVWVVATGDDGSGLVLLVLVTNTKTTLTTTTTMTKKKKTMDPANPNAALIPTCSTISGQSSSSGAPGTAIVAIGGVGGGIGGSSSAMVPVTGAGGSTLLSPTLLSPGTNTGTASIATSRDEEDDSSNQVSSAGSKSSGQRFSSGSSRTLVGPTTSLVSRSTSNELSAVRPLRHPSYNSFRTLRTASNSSAGTIDQPGAGGGPRTGLGYQSIDRSFSFNEADQRRNRQRARQSSSVRWNEASFSRQSSTSSRGRRPSRGRRFSLRDPTLDDDDEDDVNEINQLSSMDSGGGGGVGGSLRGPGGGQLLQKSMSNGMTQGAQSWKKLRAVMAYYCSLRKIKRTKSNQRWMKLRTTVQISSAMSVKKPPLKREDSFLKRFSTRQIPETQETVEDTGSEGATDADKTMRRRRRLKIPKTVVNPDENFYFYWLMTVTISILYNLWTLIVRQSFPELQENASRFWLSCDCLTDFVFIVDVAVQLRTGYLEQGLMVYDSKKLAGHYLHSSEFLFDLASLVPLDILQIRLGAQPLLRFPRFFKVYRAIKYYYIVESRTVWPNLWRVVNLIHILLILAHWFGCFYFLLSEAEGFQGDWVYPYRPGDYATLTRKYLGSLYWSTLTLTTIGDLPTPETNAEPSQSADGPRSLPRRGLKSRLLQFNSSRGYVFTIVSYLIGVFIFATIVGQVGNVITNRNANRLEFERLLDGAKTYMRHHKVPGGMKRRVLRWYDYSWSRGRIQGGGDINTALGLLPDKLKTELALHVNLSVLKKVTIFQECQPEFLHDLVLKMKAYIFTPGDSICRKGEVAREMFIIADGILEVLSETGKVLTTMKAGDFFGEIGILNLDGLNKRTADVRSVGYSELFSLSREDVLTAMKDYPEAQEILQTLGRKRLMEVRCVNKKHASKHAAKEHGVEHSSNVTNNNNNNNQGDSSDNSASKRIVDKLRSDVKGFKNALRKSRTGTTRRSNESIEMQPLHGGGGGGNTSGGSGGSASSKTPKTMLRRMPRVKSDEVHTEDEGGGRDHDKVPSPIGAGLPLLQRLRLLKEKQDREERAAKASSAGATAMGHVASASTTTAQIISPPPPHTHVTSAISPQESIQEEPEPEVIGAGLPLMQRLRMLKAKEDRQARDAQSKLQVASNQTTSSSPSLIQSLSPTSPIQVKASPPSPILNTSAAAHHGKSSMRVSFKDRIKSMQRQESKAESRAAVAAAAPATIAETTDMSQHLLTSVPTKPAKPSAAQSLKDKIRSLGHLQRGGGGDDHQLKPWSKLKLATVVSVGGSYTSLNNSFNEDSPILEQSKKSRHKTSIPADLNLSSLVSTTPPPISSAPPTTTASGSVFQPPRKVFSQSTFVDKVCTSDSEVMTSKKQPPPPPARVRMKQKPKPIQLTSEPKDYKSYVSVDDLSPEYSGLPFVKRLKILNERQKLAELESAMQTRSLSLDCTDSNSSNAGYEPIDQLSRSKSEGSGIACSHSKSASPVTHQHHRTDSGGSFVGSTPLSPESNETPERRQLKSILKKLSEDKVALDQRQGIMPNRELKKLMRAQTVEGAQSTTTTTTTTVIASATTTTTNTATNSTSEESSLSTVAENIQFTATSQLPLAPPTPPTTCDTSVTSHQALAVVSNNGYYEPDAVFHPNGDLSIADDSPSKGSSLSAFGGQRKIIKGSLEEHEFFGEVLLGIKQVIQTHMKEIQVKFQDKFFNLELEVKKRDDIISKLQHRILEMEREQQDQQLVALRAYDDDGNEDEDVLVFQQQRQGSSGSGTSRSSDELPFMRGDSLDTIFASSPHSDSDAPRAPKVVRNRKPRSSPRHRPLRNRPPPPGWDESTDQESFDRRDSPPVAVAAAVPPPVPPRRASSSPAVDRIRSPYRDIVISELTGNIISDSVIVNIEKSSSSEHSDNNYEEEGGEEEGEEEETGELGVEEEVEEEEDDEFASESGNLVQNRGSRSSDDDFYVDDFDVDEEEEEAEEEEEQMNHNDWEVRMLAAELKKRESVSTDFPSDVDEHDGLLRRRRKRSETDTDGSGAELEVLRRPRAASLDQHNLRRMASMSSAAGPSQQQQQQRRRGSIFKAMSFDRDKDRL